MKIGCCDLEERLETYTSTLICIRKPCCGRNINPLEISLLDWRLRRKGMLSLFSRAHYSALSSFDKGNTVSWSVLCVFTFQELCEIKEQAVPQRPCSVSVCFLSFFSSKLHQSRHFRKNWTTYHTYPDYSDCEWAPFSPERQLIEHNEILLRVGNKWFSEILI